MYHEKHVSRNCFLDSGNQYTLTAQAHFQQVTEDRENYKADSSCYEFCIENAN